ncbi:MAG: geranylgeranylglycerol-phosphate geranylgeranyltransferase [Flavobacteriales bacterium]
MTINKFTHFLRLIRINNLLILFLIQFLLHYFVFENNGNVQFYLLAIITFLITAAGYIINDIFDVKSDLINKKDKVIIRNHISSRHAMLWYYLFNLIAILLSVYLVCLVNNYYLLLIFLSTIYVLWWYSKRYKHILLFGNLTVSILTSLYIYNVFLFSDYSSISFNKERFYITITFVFFSFFLTLSREIIKDLEDIEGDKLMNSKNIAFTLSLNKTKWIVSILLLIVLYPLIEWFLEIFEDNNLIILIYSINLFLLIIYTIYKVVKSNKKQDFSKISQLLKFIMILGIFSIPLFYYLFK